LTPIALSGRALGTQEMLEGCLSLNGAPVQARAVETAEAQVLVVREPDNAEVLAALDPPQRARRSWRDAAQWRHRMPLDRGTTMSYTWPVITHLESEGHIPVNIFQRSGIVSSSESGMLVFLTLSYEAANRGTTAIDTKSRRRFADAVAVAGLNAITGANRRAVVLVLNRSTDQSSIEPAAVRRYLDSIGVPLFVWSPAGPRPDLAKSWGEVDDISDLTKFAVAVERLRASLASQHVVWIASDPLSALRVEADPRCGVTPLAHLGR